MSQYDSQNVPAWHWSNFQNYYNTCPTPFYTNFNYQNFPPLFNGFNGFNNFGSLYNNQKETTEKTPSLEEIYKEHKQIEKELKLIYEEQEPLIKQRKALIEYNQNFIKEIKKGKTSEGAIIKKDIATPPEFDEKGNIKTTKNKTTEKKSFGEKCLTWGSSAWSATKSFGKALFCNDEGKFDIKKTAKNLAIVGGFVALCNVPIVGPFIGAGLAASGVIGGTIGAIKNIKTLNNTKDAKKEEMARQNIITNAFVAITSAFGLKASFKGLKQIKANGRTMRINNNDNIQINTSSTVSKVKTSIKEGIKDITYQDKVNISQNGFIQTYISNLKNSLLLTSGNWKAKYQEKIQETTNKIESRIREIDLKLKTETKPSAKVLLEEEKNILNNNLLEIKNLDRNIVTKTDFDNLRSNNSSVTNNQALNNYTTNNRGYDINGTAVSEARFEKFASSVKKSQKAYNKDLKNIIDYKEYVMRSKGNWWNGKKNKSELDKYLKDEFEIRRQYPTRKNMKKHIKDLEKTIKEKNKIIKDQSSTKTEIDNAKIEKLAAEKELKTCKKFEYKRFNWFKTDSQLALGGKNPTSTLKYIKDFAISPSTRVPFMQANFEREFSVNNLSKDFTNLDKKETKKTISNLETTIKNLEKEIENIESKKTIKDWNEYKNQIAEQEAQMQKEIAMLQQQQQQVQTA